MEDMTGGSNNGIQSILSFGQSALSNLFASPVATGVAGVVVGAGLGAGITAAVTKRKRKKTTKKKTAKKRKTTKSGRARDRVFRSKQKHEQRYKRKRKYKVYKKKGWIKPNNSRRKGVHYTKNGQPYILLRSGKARFIKKRGRK